MVVKGCGFHGFALRETKSDGALRWAPVFSGEEADDVVGELLGACAAPARKAAWKSLMETLAKRAPKWVEVLRHAAERATKE